jgi:hypothetical protein
MILWKTEVRRQKSDVRFGEHFGNTNDSGLLIIELNILPVSEDLFINIL